MTAIAPTLLTRSLAMALWTLPGSSTFSEISIPSWDGSYDSVWFEGLASFARLILHDRRATGFSSRNVPVPNLETRAIDLRAVLDAAHSERAVGGAWLESLAPCVLWQPPIRSGFARCCGTIRYRALPRAPPSHGDWTSTRLPRSAAPGPLGNDRVCAGMGRSDCSTTGVRPPDDEIRHVARQSRNTCTPDVAVELTEISSGDRHRQRPSDRPDTNASDDPRGRQSPGENGPACGVVDAQRRGDNLGCTGLADGKSGLEVKSGPGSM